MRSSQLVEQLQNNTRHYEQALRLAEQTQSEADEQTLRLEQAMADGLRQIAALQLDSAPSLTSDVQRELDARERELVELRRQLARIEGEIAQVLASKAAKAEQIQASLPQRHQVLQKDPEHARLAEALATATAALLSAAPGQGEIQHECETKLAAYGQNPLYRYLLSAGFASEQYRRSTLIRSLDGWIAKRCDFTRNRASELTLLAMRDAITQAQAGQSEQVATLQASLDQRLHLAEQATGLTALREQAASLDAQIAAGKEQANHLHAQLAQYAAKTDARFVKATGLLASQLQSKSMAALIERVKATPDLADDAIAERVIGLHGELEQVRKAYPALKRAQKQAVSAYDRAKELERSLRHSRYSSDSYEYSRSLDLGSLLLGYMAGSLSKDQVEGNVRRCRQDVYVPSSSSSGSSSDSFGGGFSSSDSSGGGGFSTSDSF